MLAKRLSWRYKSGAEREGVHCTITAFGMCVSTVTAHSPGCSAPRAPLDPPPFPPCTPPSLPSPPPPLPSLHPSSPLPPHTHTVVPALPPCRGIDVVRTKIKMFAQKKVRDVSPLMGGAAVPGHRSADMFNAMPVEPTSCSGSAHSACGEGKGNRRAGCHSFLKFRGNRCQSILLLPPAPPQVTLPLSSED